MSKPSTLDVLPCRHNFADPDRCVCCKLASKAYLEIKEERERRWEVERKEQLRMTSVHRLKVACRWVQAQERVWIEAVAPMHGPSMELAMDARIAGAIAFVADHMEHFVDTSPIHGSDRWTHGRRALEWLENARKTAMRDRRVRDVGHQAACTIQRLLRGFLTRARVRRALLRRFRYCDNYEGYPPFYWDTCTPSAEAVATVDAAQQQQQAEDPSDADAPPNVDEVELMFNRVPEDQWAYWETQPRLLAGERPATPRAIGRRLASERRVGDTKMRAFLTLESHEREAKGSQNTGERAAEEAERAAQDAELLLLHRSLLEAIRRFQFQANEWCRRNKAFCVEEVPVAPADATGAPANSQAKGVVVNSSASASSTSADVTNDWIRHEAQQRPDDDSDPDTEVARLHAERARRDATVRAAQEARKAALAAGRTKDIRRQKRLERRTATVPGEGEDDAAAGRDDAVDNSADERSPSPPRRRSSSTGGGRVSPEKARSMRPGVRGGGSGGDTSTKTGTTQAKRVKTRKISRWPGVEVSISAPACDVDSVALILALERLQDEATAMTNDDGAIDLPPGFRAKTTAELAAAADVAGAASIQLPEGEDLKVVSNTFNTRLRRLELQRRHVHRCVSADHIIGLVANEEFLPAWESAMRLNDDLAAWYNWELGRPYRKTFSAALFPMRLTLRPWVPWKKPWFYFRLFFFKGQLVAATQTHCWTFDKNAWLQREEVLSAIRIFGKEHGEMLDEVLEHANEVLRTALSTVFPGSRQSIFGAKWKKALQDAVDASSTKQVTEEEKEHNDTGADMKNAADDEEGGEEDDDEEGEDEGSLTDADVTNMDVVLSRQTLFCPSRKQLHRELGKHGFDADSDDEWAMSQAHACDKREEAQLSPEHPTDGTAEEETKAPSKPTHQRGTRTQGKIGEDGEDAEDDDDEVGEDTLVTTILGPEPKTHDKQMGLPSATQQWDPLSCGFMHRFRQARSSLQQSKQSRTEARRARRSRMKAHIQAMRAEMEPNIRAEYRRETRENRSREGTPGTASTASASASRGRGQPPGTAATSAGAAGVNSDSRPKTAEEIEDDEVEKRLRVAILRGLRHRRLLHEISGVLHNVVCKPRLPDMTDCLLQSLHMLKEQEVEDEYDSIAVDVYVDTKSCQIERLEREQGAVLSKNRRAQVASQVHVESMRFYHASAARETVDPALFDWKYDAHVFYGADERFGYRARRAYGPRSGDNTHDDETVFSLDETTDDEGGEADNDEDNEEEDGDEGSDWGAVSDARAAADLQAKLDRKRAAREHKRKEEEEARRPPVSSDPKVLAARRGMKGAWGDSDAVTGVLSFRSQQQTILDEDDGGGGKAPAPGQFIELRMIGCPPSENHLKEVLPLRVQRWLGLAM